MHKTHNEHLYETLSPLAKLQLLKKSTDKSKIKLKKFSQNQTFLNKLSPAYIYELELKRKKQKQKKSSFITTSFPKINIFPSSNKTLSFLGFNTSNTFNNNKLKGHNYIQRKEIQTLETKHKKMMSQMYSKETLYSLYWPNKLLNTRYGCEFTTIGFLNGVPVINVKKKNKTEEINENEESIVNNGEYIPINNYHSDIENEDEFNISSKNEMLFNTNQKNFFKNEIKEENEDEKDDDEEEKNEINEKTNLKMKMKKINDNYYNSINNTYKIRSHKSSINAENYIEFKEIFKVFTNGESKLIERDL